MCEIIDGEARNPILNNLEKNWGHDCRVPQLRDHEVIDSETEKLHLEDKT